MKGSWVKVSLGFLLVVASIGTLLRSPYWVSLSLSYSYLVHAHSHVAFQGWVYTCLLILLPQSFLDQKQIEKGHYKTQFIITIPVIIGVLVSFSLEGYGVFSISISTVFQLLNYWFFYRFLKDSKAGAQSTSLRFVNAGLIYGFISTLAPIAVGVLAAKGQQSSEAYQSSVYTFLHLQYNGWFLLVVLGLFFKRLETTLSKTGLKYLKWFYYLMVIAVLPSISLSLLGMSFAQKLLPVGIISSAILLVALFIFIALLNQAKRGLWKMTSHLTKLIISVFLISFILKCSLQVLSVLPSVALLAFFNKPIILAYLHLSLIGVISFQLMSSLLQNEWLGNNVFGKAGLIILLAGFIISEVFLVTGGLGSTYQSKVIAIGSACMAFGILLLLFDRPSDQFIGDM